MTSWRDVLPVHPFADEFPMMKPDELKALGQDIKKRGLENRVTLYKDYKAGKTYLLDGRNRLDAMELVGLPVLTAKNELLDKLVHSTKTNLGSPPDLRAYVLSLNVHRRHLSNKQKSELVETISKAKPKISNVELAKIVGQNELTVGITRKKLEKAGKIPKVKRLGQHLSNDTRDKVLNELKTNPKQGDNTIAKKAGVAAKTVKRLRTSPVHSRPTQNVSHDLKVRNALKILKTVDPDKVSGPAKTDLARAVARIADIAQKDKAS